jgi:hypothetical protein
MNTDIIVANILFAVQHHSDHPSAIPQLLEMIVAFSIKDALTSY